MNLERIAILVIRSRADQYRVKISKNDIRIVNRDIEFFKQLKREVLDLIILEIL